MFIAVRRNGVASPPMSVKRYPPRRNMRSPAAIRHEAVAVLSRRLTIASAVPPRFLSFEPGGVQYQSNPAVSAVGASGHGRARRPHRRQRWRRPIGRREISGIIFDFLAKEGPSDK